MITYLFHYFIYSVSAFVYFMIINIQLKKKPNTATVRNKLLKS